MNDNNLNESAAIESNASVENGFAAFHLPAPLMANLMKMGFTTPTPVQAQAIPFALEGRDVLGSAQTGTGKTAAFSIPVIARLLEDTTATALIMTPTRELATQILTVIRNLTIPGIGIRTALLIGGEGMDRQYTQLRNNPQIIIGTPGRINDHLRRDGSLLEDTKIVVLDEADRMLDMGFAAQIDDVLEHTHGQKQMLMFSATFAPAIVRFSKTYLNNPQRIAIAPEQRTAARVKQETIRTTDDGRYEVLTKELDARTGSIIVFVRTKHGADRLARRLARENHSADAIHGDLRQRQRDKAIASFRAGKTRVLIATDVAARGLDVPQVEHVINYDLPQVAEDYVHRIGRTARAGAEGCALSLLMPSDSEKWNEILKVVDPDNADHGARPSGKSSKGRKGPRKDGSSRYQKPGGFNQRRAGEGFSDRKGGKPFKKREDGDFSGNKEFGDKPRFEKRGDHEERGNREDRPFKKEGFENRKPREDRGGFESRGPREDRPRREGGFENRKPREERGEKSFAGNGESAARRGAGRFEKKEGGYKDGGFKKGGFKKEGGFKKGGFKGGKPGGGFKGNKSGGGHKGGQSRANAG
jgi:superfamily II DNA/RNA helicase